MLLVVLACSPRDGGDSAGTVAACVPIADQDSTCDGVDDDCDGHPDDDAPTTRAWYADADGDGYGDMATATVACTQPEGMIEDFRDCDDSDGAVHPDAPEDTCDGVDDDCDHDFDEDAPTATTFYRDTDGDGFGDPADPVIGCAAPEGAVADDTDCEPAAALAHPGGAETCDGALDEDCDGVTDEACGGPVTVALGVGDTILEALDDGLYNEDDAYVLTVRVASEGDLTGDGADDLVVGFPYSDDHGRLYLVDGLPEGDVDISTVSRTIEAVDEDARFAWAVSLLPDMDGDGRSELGVGAPGVNGGAGAVYLFAGGDGSTPDDAGTVLRGTGTDEVGTSIADAGNALGGGTRGVVIGAVGLNGVGGAYLVQTGANGTVDLAGADARLIAESAGTQVGEHVADAGDVDGDGVDDVLIGGADYDLGSAYLVYGPIAGDVYLADAGARFVEEDVGDGAGQGLIGPGDVDGDGLDDVLVGAPLHGGEGRAYVVTGAPTGDVALATAWAQFTGGPLDYDLGAAVSAAGDIDGDGQPDLWISDPFWSSVGAVWLATSVRAGAWSIDEVGSLIGAPDYDGFATQYGSGMATGDLDGDGSMEVTIAGDSREYVNRTAGWF